jgi:hypothetical protein
MLLAGRRFLSKPTRRERNKNKMFYCSSKCKESEETFRNKLVFISSSNPYRVNGRNERETSSSYERVAERNQCCSWCGKSTSFSSGLQRGDPVVYLSTRAITLSIFLNYFTE